jgi:hypothetical protein
MSDWADLPDCQTHVFSWSGTILTSRYDTLFKITPNGVQNEPQPMADWSNPKLGAASFLADSKQNVKNGATARLVIGYIIQCLMRKIN